MRSALLLLALLAFPSGAAAQPTLKRELGRLGFMVGSWEGTGWARYAPDGPAREARVTARGEPRLAGTVLAWSSQGTSTDGSAATVASSDLTIRFRADSAVFRATVQHGSSSVEAWVRPGVCDLAWGYVSPADPRTLFRFTSRLEGMRRVETGERSPDGGRTWWAFYGAEMQGLAVTGCDAPVAPAGGS